MNNYKPTKVPSRSEDWYGLYMVIRNSKVLDYVLPEISLQSFLEGTINYTAYFQVYIMLI